MLVFTTSVTAAEASFAVVSIIVGSGTVAFVLYLVIRAIVFMYGFLGRDLALTLSIWITRIWFIVSLDWSRSVWVVVMGVGMLGFVYRGVGAINVLPGVLGRNITLAASTWRTRPWFLVAVACNHNVWVVDMYVGMLGLMLFWFG